MDKQVTGYFIPEETEENGGQSERTNSNVVESDRVLYTPSAFARASLLHLQEIGQLTALQPHTSSRSNLASYLFFTVLSGVGVLQYDGKEYELNPRACVFIDCMNPYSHTTSDPLWTINWIHFNGPSMPAVYRKYIDRGGQSALILNSTEEINHLWANLMAIAKSSDHMRDMKINRDLSALLVSVMTESWHPENVLQTSKRTGVTEVREYLEEHFAERITVEELANRFLISSSYLAHSFKKQYETSIMTCLLRIRITKAKQLLRFTSKTVEEIGYEDGIGGPSYFSRVFKETEGVSPSTYREQW